MKLQVRISIDIDAEDYVAAAEHQRRAEAMLTRVRAEYAQARLTFDAARGRPPAAARPRRRSTGNLAAYAEL